MDSTIDESRRQGRVLHQRGTVGRGAADVDGGTAAIQIHPAKVGILTRRDSCAYADLVYVVGPKLQFEIVVVLLSTESLVEGNFNIRK